MQYRTGSATVNNGSNEVVGTDTDWSMIPVGAVFTMTGSDLVYRVTEIVGPTQVNITPAWAGPDASGAYWITKDFTPINGLPVPQRGDVDAMRVLEEALLAIDTKLPGGLVGIFSVDALNINVPPVSPADGYSVIVGPAPTGVFASYAGQVALYRRGVWTFHKPSDGAFVRVNSANAFYFYKAATNGWELNPLTVNNSINKWGDDVYGALCFPSGSVTAPTISFNADRDTGIYRVGEDRLGIAVGGLQAIHVSKEGSGTKTIIRGDVVFEGTTITANAQQVTVADNTVLLSSLVKGAPTLNAGVEINRGTSTNASLLWNETSDLWTVGMVGSEQAIATRQDNPVANGLVFWNTASKRFDTNTAVRWVSGELLVNGKKVLVDGDTTAGGSGGDADTLGGATLAEVRDFNFLLNKPTVFPTNTSNVSGLADYVAARIPDTSQFAVKANPVFSGTLTTRNIIMESPSSGTSAISFQKDGALLYRLAAQSDRNLVLAHYNAEGIGANLIVLRDSNQTMTVRASTDFTTDLTVNGKAVLTTASFDPNTKANLSGGNVFNGVQKFKATDEPGMQILSDDEAFGLRFSPRGNISYKENGAWIPSNSSLKDVMLKTEIPTFSAYASGPEGGEIRLAKSEGFDWAGNMVMDIYGNNIRFWEQGGGYRGFYLDIREGIGGHAKIAHSNNLDSLKIVRTNVANVFAGNQTIGGTSAQNGLTIETAGNVTNGEHARGAELVVSSYQPRILFNDRSTDAKGALLHYNGNATGGNLYLRNDAAGDGLFSDLVLQINTTNKTMHLGGQNVLTAATGVTQSATNLGRTDNVAIIGGTRNAAWWGGTPAGYSVMMNLTSANGSPENGYGYFFKTARRDTDNGWVGLWQGYHTGELFYGGSFSGLDMPSWHKIWSTKNFNPLGKLDCAVNGWRNDASGHPRFYFADDSGAMGRTYIRGKGFEVRSPNDHNRFSVDEFGLTTLQSDIWHQATGGQHTFYFRSADKYMFIRGENIIFRNAGNTTLGEFKADGKLYVGGDIYNGTNTWFRVRGSNCGIHWENFNGGWFMSDTNWIRAYNNKGILTTGTVQMGAFTVTSDRRLKRDFVPIRNAAEIIDNTEVYEFTKGDKRMYGVIAQEAQEVAPILVGEGGELAEDGTPYLTVDMTGYIAVIMEEMKALRKRVAKLEARA